MTASARGLFHATGKRAKPRAVRRADGGIVKAATVERERDDFYPTAFHEPIRALIRHEGARIGSFPALWEPAAGDGAMARALREGGCRVEMSDLVDRGAGAELRDFFAFEVPLAPAIVTNPPYHLCNAAKGRGRWIWHAMGTLGIEYMALLLSWAWPGAGGHARLWATWPPARVYLMRWRLDFTGGGASPMLNAWFVWDRAWSGETALRMMDQNDDCRQEQLL